MINRTFVAALGSFVMVHLAQAADYMKAFPVPEKGVTRYVIALQKEENEANLKLELAIGKTVLVEPANQYFFGGKVETETAQGWGFTYYVLPQLGPMASTLMAVDPNAPKVERFIRLAGEAPLLRYNSKLPVVVYVPQGVEVRYRIWHASAELIKATEK
jgi:ecotin